MKFCESCSYPLNIEEDFGGGDPTSKYCKYCAPEGKLLEREVIRSGWIQALMGMEGLSEEAATEKVDAHMPNMPAWKE